MRAAELEGGKVDTIYFGGGTPSLLPSIEIDRILNTIHSHHSLADSLEITLEANPDDLTPRYVNSLMKTGVNRLSIGIQSFDAKVLKWMNRAHTSEQALNCVGVARSAGFENISIDLIYGVPITDYQPESDLGIAMELTPQHVSAYNLTIEHNTVFGHRLRNGLLVEVPDEEAASNFQLVMDTLRTNQYRHYEISNFALPGYQSRHNLSYWNGIPYLGVGPSAHSFRANIRQFNISNNARYIRAIKLGELPVESEKLSAKQRINEMIMLGLRTNKGVALELNYQDLKWDPDPDQLDTLVANKFAYIYQNRLILTDKGKMIADSITESLMIT